MPQYRYEGRDDVGNPMSGVIEAESLQEATKLAFAHVRWVTRIDLVEPRGEDGGRGPAIAAVFRYSGIRPGIGPGKLAWLLEQFRSHVRAGQSPPAAFNRIVQGCGGKLASVVSDLARRTASGESVSSVMSHYPDVFPDDLRAGIKLGETEGEIISYLPPFIDRYKSIHHIRTMQTLSVCSSLILTFIWHAGTARGSDQKSDLRPIIFLVVGTSLLLVISNLIASITTPYQRDWLKLCAPRAGRFHREFVITNLVEAMGRQYAAGIPMSQAIENAADACGNVAIGREARRAAILVRSGQRVETALAKCLCLPGYAQQLLGTAQETGDFDLLCAMSARIGRVETGTEFEGTVAGHPLLGLSESSSNRLYAINGPSSVLSGIALMPIAALVFVFGLYFPAEPEFSAFMPADDMQLLLIFVVAVLLLPVFLVIWNVESTLRRMRSNGPL